MKLHWAVLSQAAFASSLFAGASTEFTSRVFFVIQETSPFQIERSRRMVQREFNDTFANSAVLQGRRYQVVADGSEVIFSLVTPEDVRGAFQNTVSETVGQLNGRVRTRGRYDFLRTDFEETPKSSLLVVLDDSNTKIRTLVARSVPVRDLLSELQLQFREAHAITPEVLRQRRLRSKRAKSDFSYFMPSNCLGREIDWNYGAPPEVRTPENTVIAAKTIEDTMQEIARVFRLAVENHNGNYRFSGDCPPTPQPTTAFEFLPTRWIVSEPEKEAPPPPAPISPIRPIPISRFH